MTYWTDAWLERIQSLYAAHDELMTAWNQAAAPPDKTAAPAGSMMPMPPPHPETLPTLALL